MIPPVFLDDGLTYQPIVHKSMVFDDESFVTHLASARWGNDRLAANYTFEAISRMAEYGYVYENDPTDLVYMTGIEAFGSGCYRIESRTFISQSRRRKFWRCPDNYQTVEFQIKQLVTPRLLFKSREANNGAGFEISRRLAPHLFHDWITHPTPIELRYANNWQYIMYRNVDGDVSLNLKSLEYNGLHS